MKTHPVTDLATLFFGDYRRQVLGLLLLHSDEAFHLREIARITATQPGTLRRELLQLTEAGVLSRERLGNLDRYRANPDCPIYDELRGILKKTVGVVDVLRAALSPLAGDIAAAFVYGSVASGGERRGSDIDVMVIGGVTFEDVVLALNPSQEALRREINPNVYRPGDFRKQAAKRGSFVARVLKQPKLYIQGSDDDLGKPTAGRKTKTA